MVLDDKIIDVIVRSHEISGGNSGHAKRYIENEYRLIVSPSTITKYWRKNNLEPAGKTRTGNRLSDEEITEIRNAYGRYNGSARLASQNMDYSHSTILKYWEKQKEAEK